MRFRRRRKPKVVWLSPSGTPYTAGLAAGEQPAFTEFAGTVTLQPLARPTIETPLLVDGPDINQMSAAIGAYQGFNLNDVQQPGYLLRRVVGKFHCTAIADPGLGGEFDDNNSALFVTAGLIIRRVDDAGAAIATGQEVNVQTIQNIKDPWIWRRTWVLRNSNMSPETAVGLLSTVGAASARSFPGSTAGYGSVADGPHMDAKTRRVVAAEERLFLDVSVLSWNAEPQVAANWTLKYRFDYRALASLRFSGGNRRNASR